jgi:hypothetical protein
LNADSDCFGLYIGYFDAAEPLDNRPFLYTPHPPGDELLREKCDKKSSFVGSKFAALITGSFLNGYSMQWCSIIIARTFGDVFITEASFSGVTPEWLEVGL